VAVYFPATEAAGEISFSPTGSCRPQFHSFGRGRKVMKSWTTIHRPALGRRDSPPDGFLPDSFFEPLAALKKFESSAADYVAVVSDLTMPGMTGGGTRRRFRKIRPMCPFVLTSGYLHNERRTARTNQAFTHFIKKRSISVNSDQASLGPR